MRSLFPALLLALACAGPPRPLSEVEGPACDPSCPRNLLCKQGQCTFEPIACAQDSDCPARYVCREELCKLPGGKACRFASQCASQKCVWGLCAVQL